MQLLLLENGVRRRYRNRVYRRDDDDDDSDNNGVVVAVIGTTRLVHTIHRVRFLSTAALAYAVVGNGTTAFGTRNTVRTNG